MPDTYYVMDQSYDFVEVAKPIYDNPTQSGYIGNRACYRRTPDGAAFLDLDVHNCDAGSFGELYRKLFPSCG